MKSSVSLLANNAVEIYLLGVANVDLLELGHPLVLALLADSCVNHGKDNFFIFSLRVNFLELSDTFLVLWIVGLIRELDLLILFRHADDVGDDRLLAILLFSDVSNNKVVFHNDGNLDHFVSGAHVLVLLVGFKEILANDVALNVTVLAWLGKRNLGTLAWATFHHEVSLLFNMGSFLLVETLGHSPLDDTHCLFWFCYFRTPSPTLLPGEISGYELNLSAAAEKFSYSFLLLF